jgi:hypothetical protein
MDKGASSGRPVVPRRVFVGVGVEIAGSGGCLHIDPWRMTRSSLISNMRRILRDVIMEARMEREW